MIDENKLIDHFIDKTPNGWLVPICENTSRWSLEGIISEIKHFKPLIGMKKYKSFHVGGDPSRIAFLAEDLDRKLDFLQEAGWEIDSINQIDNNRAWDMHKQRYVSTPEYIIIAKMEVTDEKRID